MAEARRARGLTLQRIAERVGCARSYLSLIENGRRPPPGEEMLVRLEEALGLSAGTLVGAARWEATPPDVRKRIETDRRAAARLAAILRSPGHRGDEGSVLDRAYRSGELRRLIDALAPESSPARSGGAEDQSRNGGDSGEFRTGHLLDVPLINRVAAGYPREFTDLGYPARVADEYVRCPGLSDPDAFACRVVGDSMLPEYREGDIVVFSPLKAIRSGMDCFARIEPDHESTFKRVYFEAGEDGGELIRLQPLNSAYRARVLAREDVAGLYAAVSVTREVGGGE